VLSVTDGGDDFGPVRTEYSSLESFDAVAVLDNDGTQSTLVLFRRDDGDFGAEELPRVECRNILIVGLRPGGGVTITRRGNGALVLAQADPATAGALSVSDQGTVYAEPAP